MPGALAAVYPATIFQTCVVHLIRNSLDFANWEDRKSLAMALKPISTKPLAWTMRDMRSMRLKRIR